MNNEKEEINEECKSESSGDTSFPSTSSCNCGHKHKPAKYKAAPVTRKMKIGRNDLCPCRSGKKYKKCCLN